jgi:hypothetical protein
LIEVIPQRLKYPRCLLIFREYRLIEHRAEVVPGSFIRQVRSDMALKPYSALWSFSYKPENHSMK